MKNLHIFTNVERFYSSPTQLIFIENNVGLVSHSLTHFEKKILLKSPKLYSFKIINNDIYYQYENGGDLLVLNNNLLYKGKFYLSSSIIWNRLLIIDKKNLDSKQYEIHFIENEENKLSKLVFFPDIIIDDFKYLFIAVNTIHIYSFNNELIWQKQFRELLNSEEIILRNYYVYQNKLIIHLRTNGLPSNEYVTVVLDVATGNELHRTPQPMGDKLIDGLGYTLYEKRMWISNPDTYEVQMIDFSEELSALDQEVPDRIGEVDLGTSVRKFEFSPQYFSVEYPYLYFAQNRGLQVGMIDIEKRKLLWHTEIEEDGVIKDLKSGNNRLYVHTTNNNLYVYG